MMPNYPPERRKSYLTEEDKAFIANLSSYKNADRRVFGFKIQELVMLFTILFGILAFYWRTDDAMRRLITITDYLVRFAQNSDNYHSAVGGIQFDQGKPASFSGDVYKNKSLVK